MTCAVLHCDKDFAGMMPRCKTRVWTNKKLQFTSKCEQAVKLGHVQLMMYQVVLCVKPTDGGIQRI